MKAIARHLVFCFLVGTVPVILCGHAGSASAAENAIRDYLQQGNYQKALTEIRKDLDFAKDRDIAYAYLYCLYQLGEYGRLIRTLQSKKFEDVAGESRTQILAGLALFQKGNIPAATMVWALNAAANPKDDRAWDCLFVAVLSVPRRQRTQTVEMAMSILKGQPFAEGLLLGITDMIRGDSKSAERRLRAAHEVFPESATAVRALLEFYRHEGIQAEANVLEKELSERSEHGYKSNNINNQNTDSGAPTIGHYCLPWPEGYTYYCASHRGRRDSPHRDRGQYALDFYLPHGTPILAARAGIVREIADTAKIFGTREFETYVLVEHDDGTWARYFHITPGATPLLLDRRVEQGQMLGIVGRTGRSQSRHLHFEVVRRAPWRHDVPAIYSRWETIPVDFVETRNLPTEAIPGCWLTSSNIAL
ncbi:MAG: peptidoglycan DD-metalloendopeptidase family protein [Candidatus Sumerlaeia bacterium]|nr:peptidoglycan DD-metalloendopeptidase family protein [Candidatus Sumerlaeia bacterium]